MPLPKLSSFRPNYLVIISGNIPMTAVAQSNSIKDIHGSYQ